MLTSHPSDAKFVVRQLRRKGLFVRHALQANFLGVDMSAGRMARVTRAKRDAKAKATSRRIQGFAKASRKYVSMGLIERAGSQAA
eukprot:9385924-Pyramimonas_sp.AAC.1